MANSLFPFSSINFSDNQGRSDHLTWRDDQEDTFTATEQGWREGDFFPSTSDDFHPEKTAEEVLFDISYDHQQPIWDFRMQGNLHLSGTPLPLQPIPEDMEQETGNRSKFIEIGELNMEGSGSPFPMHPFKLLSNYASSTSMAREENIVSNVTSITRVDGRKLSTEEIVRLAGERYVEFSTRADGGFYPFIHPYGCDLLGVSMEENQDIELVQQLLSAAEKVGYRQFGCASRLLAGCELASDRGSPVKRIVFYFAEALQERIDRETGKYATKGTEKQGEYAMRLASASSLEFLAYHQEIPFVKAIQYAGVQAILENVASATTIHLIDLQIKSGIQWIILMQALADREDRPIKLLRITALGTTNKEDLERTCIRLLGFAESLNLPFSFKIVLLSDMKDIKAEQIEIGADETVAVYSQTALSTMISRPEYLDSIMIVIKTLKPAIMVVSELEANHNSSSFAKRFTEALFYHSAYFDCFEACMGRDSENRKVMEGVYFRDGIRNMVSTDGEERTSRTVKIEVWRAFFARFGMVEIDLSESSLHQARLVAELFDCKSACTLEKNGNSLLLGWKGTPLHSVSAWKFS
ncbi:DELLA protein RGL1-like [Diospyros lotus]|uniref:DELLA protein RGL1-like n=1 Tax=Diospyros lotus TaxID=55363 RepID=UPI00224EA936|nr:DELLA protein RGL1-like [Diospyros lotus]